MTAKKAPIDAEIVEPETPGKSGPMQELSLVPSEARMQLAITRQPEDVLKDAKHVADVLMEVIHNLPEKHRVMMNNEQYITFDSWQLIANFYGCTPKVTAVEMVQIQMGSETIVGFKATADLIHVASGRVISSASSLCSNDEEKWSDRTKYDWHYVLRDGSTQKDDPGIDNIVWVQHPTKVKANGKPANMPKKERVMVGSQKVPLFQLMSMAQTRAEAKVCRNVFSHVAVLAGYSPTPAEEMMGPLDETPPASAYENGSESTEGTALAEKVAQKAQAMAEPPPPKKGTAKRAAGEKATVNNAPRRPAPPPPTPPSAHQPAAAPPASPPPGNGRKPSLSPNQVKRLWAIATANGWDQKQVKAMLIVELKLPKNAEVHTEDIPTGRQGYDRICDNILVDGPTHYFEVRQ